MTYTAQITTNKTNGAYIGNLSNLDDLRTWANQVIEAEKKTGKIAGKLEIWNGNSRYNGPANRVIEL
jgi:hypothetical protein